MLLTRRGALGVLSAAALTARAACGRDAGPADPNASSALKGEIRGAGATSQSDAQDSWMNAFMGANLRATVDYAGGGSGAGRTKLAEGAVDYAGTDTPMTTDEISRIGGVVELPLYISPIAVAYNLPGFTGESHVNMTGEVLAKVLSGAITRWNDPALAALNPGAALPDDPPHLVAAVPAGGHEPGVGQVDGAHPVTGVGPVPAEGHVPGHQAPDELLLVHLQHDEQVDPLPDALPAKRVQRQVVALGDDDPAARHPRARRHRLVQVAAVHRCQDLAGLAVGAHPAHPLQDRQVAVDVEGVRRALAPMAAELVEDCVGHVEAVHGHDSRQQPPLAERRLQGGCERGLSRPRRTGDADDGSARLGPLRQPPRGIDQSGQEDGGLAGELRGSARISIHAPIVSSDGWL